MYVYFSITEKQFSGFDRAMVTLKENELEKDSSCETAVGQWYNVRCCKIDTVSEVIDQTTGSVSMRAIFPNSRSTSQWWYR